MATKRGMCPYCRNKNYFLVNPEAMSCFCGTNMHQLSPVEAIGTYNKYIEDLLDKAKRSLQLVGNAEQAYQEFADVIEIDDSITYAYLGRILCLIFMSTIRKSFINDARLLLDTSAEEYFRKTSEYPMIITTIKEIVKIAEEYVSDIHKKLSLKTYFYDEKCLRIYLTRVNEVKNFENEALEVVTAIKKKFANEKVDLLLNFLDELITNKERILNDYDHILVSGDHYVVSEIKSNGELDIQVVENKKTDTTKLQRYRMASLDSSNKKARYIKDEVFKDYTGIIRARRVIAPWFVICYVASVFCGVSAFIFRHNPIVFYTAVATGGLMLILGLIFMIMFISWGIKLKRKKEKVENFNKHTY